MAYRRPPDQEAFYDDPANLDPTDQYFMDPSPSQPSGGAQMERQPPPTKRKPVRRINPEEPHRRGDEDTMFDTPGRFTIPDTSGEVDPSNKAFDESEISSKLHVMTYVLGMVVLVYLLWCKSNMVNSFIVLKLSEVEVFHVSCDLSFVLFLFCFVFLVSRLLIITIIVANLKVNEGFTVLHASCDALSRHFRTYILSLLSQNCDYNI